MAAACFVGLWTNRETFALRWHVRWAIAGLLAVKPAVIGVQG